MLDRHTNRPILEDAFHPLHRSAYSPSDHHLDRLTAVAQALKVVYYGQPSLVRAQCATGAAALEGTIDWCIVRL